MAYYGYPQINPALQNWYGQFYQPVQQPIQPQVQPQMQPQTVPQMGQFQQQAQQAQQQQSQQMQQPTIQQSGFVLVQSEQEARAYPVAPGNSITFKDERQPYCYVKTMSYNQLDPPVFERYRLVKENAPPEAREALTTDEQSNPAKNTAYATKDDLVALWDELEALKERLKAQGEKKTVKARKVTEETEVSDDE